MYNHILIAVSLDHENDMVNALAIARKLRAEGGRITALHVIEDLPSYATQYVPQESLTNFHKEIGNSLHHLLRDADDVVPAVITGHAGRSIVEHADAQEVDCIIIASHRPGLQDYFLGSTAGRVVRHANCAVHVLR